MVEDLIGSCPKKVKRQILLKRNYRESATYSCPFLLILSKIHQYFALFDVYYIIYYYLCVQNLTIPIKKIHLSEIIMNKNFIQYLIEGNNNPPAGSVSFDSSDHIRFQNGQNVSGHNCGCNRRFIIEKNIEGDEGYTVTIYNLDGVHPLWQNNVQMAPKRMRIINVDGNIVQLRGYGFDMMGGSFTDYGVSLLIENEVISRSQLDMYDRNVSIVYLK